MSVDEQLIGLNLLEKGDYHFAAVASTGGGGGGGGGGSARRDNRVQKYFKYGFIDKKMKKNEVGYLYENQMKEVFDAFLNARQVGQGITTLPCAGATCALPDLGLVSGEFDNEAHTVSILDSNLNLCALELKTSAAADFGQIAFEAVISPRIGWRIASKSKTAAGSPLWSKAVFDGAIIPHLEKMWPLENIAKVYAAKGGPVYLKRLGFNIVVRDGAVLLKGMRPMGIGEDITTFAQMSEFFNNAGAGRWLSLYRSWYATTARSRNSDELTSQQRNAFTKYLWDNLKQEAMFYYGPDSGKFKRETPVRETEKQKKKRIGAAKTEAKRHATANMVYLMEDAKRFAGIHPQQEALRAGSAGGGGRSSRSPPAFSQPPIAARTLGGSPTREGDVDGKAADQLRRILQERFEWETHSRDAMELHIPATKETISPYYLMKGCQFIQIGSGVNVGLYSLGASITMGNKQILSFNDMIKKCQYRIRMKAGDSFFRTHDFKLAIKIVFRNTLLQKQRVNLNLSEDRNAFLGWLIGMYSQQKAMGYNYAHAFPWEVVELSLPEPLMNNRARQQAKASVVALAGLGGRRQSGASLVRGGGGGGGGGGGAASFFSPLKRGGRNQARAPTARASAQRIAAAAARASAQRIAAAAERAADQRRAAAAAAAAAATRGQANAARTARRNARERSGGYQRRTKRRKKRKRTRHKKRRKRKKPHRRRRRTRRKKY
jgi:hypothetical protein